MAGFTITIVLLESGALMNWAEKLDIGPARSAALPATSVLHKTLAPLGVEQLRNQSLTGLDRLGWTDDPARLLAAREHAAPDETCSATTAKAPAPKLTLPKPIDLPIAASVPRLTPLAPLPPAPQDKPRVVALTGDSMMAVGLSNILLRQTAGNQDLRVIKAFRSGTGLARPDVFDWMQEYPAMIAGEKPDAVIVAIGANDGQGFVEDGKTLVYGSDAWTKVYEQRTADFLNLLTRDGARVVWVGLPPMKSGAYNDRIAQINRIAYSVVSRNPLATWWNPQPYIADDTGAFRELETTPDGKTTRIRATDGIHLSDDGAALLTPTLIDWLHPAPQVTTAQITPQDKPLDIAGRHRRASHSHTARN